jgi:hypothetical protein
MTRSLRSASGARWRPWQQHDHRLALNSNAAAERDLAIAGADRDTVAASSLRHIGDIKNGPHGERWTDRLTEFSPFTYGSGDELARA